MCVSRGFRWGQCLAFCCVKEAESRSLFFASPALSLSLLSRLSRPSCVNLFNIQHSHLPPTRTAICMYLWIQIWWRESERAWVLGVEKSNAFYHYKMLCIFTYAPFTLKRFNILQNHLVFECEVAVRPFSFFWSITLWISLPLSSIRFIHSACFWLEKKRRCF